MIKEELTIMLQGIGRFDTNRFDTNSSNELTQKFR